MTNLDASGEKSMSICQTAAISPYPEEVDFDYLAEAKYVHMIGTYPHLVLPVGREAKKRGVRVSLDFEPGVGPDDPRAEGGDAFPRLHRLPQRGGPRLLRRAPGP